LKSIYEGVGRMKILIIDDKEENLYLLESLLKGSGYEVTSAKDGVEALERLKRNSINMIISDILMPRMDGFQLCRECKRSDTLRKIPFVFYTATYTDKRDEEFALSLGAERFIVKPMEPERFMEIIEGILEGYKKGLLTPSEIPVEKEEVVYLKEYNERLIKKLEGKMLDLKRDIAERKRAEEALHESKQRLELALRGADLGLWDWNVQTGELIFDQRWANMLGYSLEEIEPHIRTWEKLVHPDDMPGVMEVLNAHLAGKTPFYETEYRLLTKSGEWKWILGRGRLVEWDKDGKPLRAAGTHLDITERKKVERMQRLVQLGRLVANIAHEVNNPLMIISGRAQLSLMEEVESEEIKKNLQIIFEQTQRAKDIIQRFLRFSKPAKGELKQVDINRSIEEITGIIEHQFKLGGVKIKRNYAQNLPFVSIDEKQIQEVFMNILTNAYDAISGEGIIEITISCEKDFLRIDFKDTGKGMSKEIIDKIFDPFFTTKEKGTGLGLSVCYGIIKAHNGELKFQSLPGQKGD
jgi:PAS domain S-box-containing protein